MKTRFAAAVRPLAYALLMSISLAACGGGAEEAPAPKIVTALAPAHVDLPNTPPPLSYVSVAIPEAALRLIATDHSATPELKTAAVGFAEALVSQWQAAATTGLFDEALALKARHSEVCLVTRSERLGRPVTEETLAQLYRAVASTHELLAAKQVSDSLQTGKPLAIATDELQACAFSN